MSGGSPVPESSFTVAVELVSESTCRAVEDGRTSVIINTLLEHNSNELPWRAVPGASLVRLPMDADGFLDAGQLEALLGSYNETGEHGAKRVTLVAVSGASNVLGVPPWAERLQSLILIVLRRFELPGVVRVSLGIENSEEDVDTLIRVMGGIAIQSKHGASEKAVRQQMDDACKASAERVYGQ